MSRQLLGYVWYHMIFNRVHNEVLRKCRCFIVLLQEFHIGWCSQDFLCMLSYTVDLQDYQDSGLPDSKVGQAIQPILITQSVWRHLLGNLTEWILLSILETQI